MYHLRRVYKTKPGEARKVATLAHLEAQILRDAGQRGEFNVYFNPETTPGEKNRVVLQWNDDMIGSIFRSENDVPYKALEIQRESVDLTENNWLEINELLTSEKIVQ